MFKVLFSLSIEITTFNLVLVNLRRVTKSTLVLVNHVLGDFNN